MDVVITLQRHRDDDEDEDEAIISTKSGPVSPGESLCCVWRMASVQPFPSVVG